MMRRIRPVVALACTHTRASLPPRAHTASSRSQSRPTRAKTTAVNATPQSGCERFRADYGLARRRASVAATATAAVSCEAIAQLAPRGELTRARLELRRVVARRCGGGGAEAMARRRVALRRAQAAGTPPQQEVTARRRFISRGWRASTSTSHLCLRRTTAPPRCPPRAPPSPRCLPQWGDPLAAATLSAARPC